MAAADGPAVTAVRERLNDVLRITLDDGRVVVGNFQCFDKQRNVLLYEAKEQRYTDGKTLPSPPRAPDFERHLGLVLVPRKHIVTAHAIDDSTAAGAAGGVAPS